MGYSSQCDPDHPSKFVKTPDPTANPTQRKGYSINPSRLLNASSAWAAGQPPCKVCQIFPSAFGLQPANFFASSQILIKAVPAAWKALHRPQRWRPPLRVRSSRRTP